MHALAPGALVPGTVKATWHFWRAGFNGNVWRRGWAHMGLDAIVIMGTFSVA